MTELTRQDRVVAFGPGLPTVIIGERINPTGRRKFGEALARGDLDVVRAEAVRQSAAGADILDVNVGVGGIDEAAVLRDAVQVVMEASELPLCIDSSDPKALIAAMEVYRGKALVNSVTAEDASLEEILPLVAQYGAAVIALPHDEQGIPPDPQDRVRFAEVILERAKDAGIPPEDVVVDCLTMPVGADQSSGRAALETLRLLRDKLGVSTTMGASNVSFGLPDRRILNLAFLAMSIHDGVSAPITDPLLPGVRRLCRAVDFFLAADTRGRRYVADYRAFPDD
ncbi:MAG TPA: dihydropteroate synthase [Acidimicrobiales bacterium]|nr:dihydropteroate synthase [Acidimicrobiales bacterium]